jgi:Flp pilus assembly protein TadG
MLPHSVRRNLPRLAARRGSATLWMLIWVPCLLVLLSVLLNVANLWLARVELETALEAAALAAVKEWGDSGGGETFPSRQVGMQYASANIIGAIRS